MPRARLVLLLLIAVVPGFVSVGCGAASNPTDEAVVIVQEPAPTPAETPAEGSTPADGTVPPP